MTDGGMARRRIKLSGMGWCPACEATHAARRLPRPVGEARIVFADAHPRRAASIAAMSILPIVIIASNARLAAARSGSV